MKTALFTICILAATITGIKAQTWTSQTSGATTTLRNVNFPDSCTGYIFGSSGTILKTTNRGGNWSSINTSSTFTIYSSYFFNSAIGIAVGQHTTTGNGATLLTVNGGTSWTIDSTTYTVDRLLDIHFANTSVGWMCGRSGYLLKSITSGLTWTEQTSNSGEHLNSVHATGINTCYAVGDVGTIITTVDGGTTWTPQTSGITDDLFSVFFVSSLKGWAVGQVGTILVTVDGGVTWTPQTSGTTLTLNDVVFVNDSTGWAVGNTGTIITTSDGGTTWTSQSSGVSVILRSIDMQSSNLGWIAGSTGTALYYGATPPVANFTTNFSVCLNDVNSFTDQSTGTPTSWLWNFGDATTSTLQNPDHTYTSVGTYTVSLTISNAGGCFNTITKSVVVNPGIPVANFSGTPTTICTGGTVTFTDLSTSSPTSWDWDFGDGNTSTLQNPSNIYAAAGTYDVKLIATNGCGSNTMTSTTYITVLNSPTADFTSTTVCLGNPTVFTDASSGSISGWTWNFGDGSPLNTNQNPSYTYSTATIYFVTLTVTSPGGCTNSTAKFATVNALPVADFNASIVCLNQSTAFTDVSTGTPVSWTWNFGDGNSSTIQNPSNTYLAFGNYNVQLSVKNALNCGSSLTKSIAVLENPVASYTSSTVCKGNNTLFSNTSTNGFTWLWNFGDATSDTSKNPSHKYASAGVFSSTLSVISTNGCSNSAAANVTVFDLPVANAGLDDSILCTQTKDLLATATGGSGTYAYSWSNGIKTSNNNGVAPGTYIVTVTDGNGCLSNDAVSVFLKNSTLSITGTNDGTVCNGDIITINVVASGGTTPYSYLWNTGATSTSINVGAGTYSVKVTDNVGCNVSDLITITNNPVLSANAGIDITVCNGKNATLTAIGVGGNGVYTYKWSTGSTSSSISMGSGTYTVTVTDGIGCKAADVVVVTDNPTLTIKAGNDTVACFAGTVQVSAKATGGNGIYTQWWSNGDSGAVAVLATGINIAYVMDGIGCIASDSIVVNAISVIANAGIDDSVLCGLKTNLLASATGGISPYSYLWNNGVATANNDSVSAGNYMVQITDAIGCKDDDFVSVFLKGSDLSVIASSDVSVCFGETTTISAVALNGTPSYSYAWSSGSTNAGTTVGGGTYTIQVTDNAGCKVSDFVVVTENSVLTVTAGTDQTIGCSKTADLTAIASGGDGAYSYLWSNGVTMAVNNSVNAGSYIVSVSDGVGCKATDLVLVNLINSDVKISVSNDTSICNGELVTLNAVGSGSYKPFSYNWSTFDITSSITVGGGIYYVSVIDSIGCSASDSILVNEATALSVFAGNDDSIACGVTTSLTAVVTGGTTPYTYLWSDGSTTTSLSSIGAGTYFVNSTDALGCQSNTDTVTIKLIGSTFSLVVSSDQTICFGTTTTISAVAINGTTPYTYKWSSGESTSGITVSGGTYTVVATDNAGCSISDFVVITETSPLLVDIGIDITICSGDIITIVPNVSGGDGVYSYSWSDGSVTDSINAGAGSYLLTVTDATGCSDFDAISISESLPLSVDLGTDFVNCIGSMILSPVISGGDNGNSYLWSTGATTQTISVTSGTFSILVNDAAGCFSVEDSVVITGGVLVVADFSTSADTIDLGVTQIVSLTDASTGATSWKWDFGNGSNSTSQNPSAVYTATGTYLITLIASDGICSDTISKNLIVITTSIFDLQKDLYKLVYPNPTKGIIHVEIPFIKDINIDIYNVIGEKILIDENLYINKSYVLDISILENGIYFIQVKNDKTNSLIRVIKTD